MSFNTETEFIQAIEEAGQIVTKSIYAELIPSAPNLILTEKLSSG